MGLAISGIRYPHHAASADTGRKLKYIRRLENVLDVFLTSYVSSIYVLCLRGHLSICFMIETLELHFYCFTKFKRFTHILNSVEKDTLN